MVIPVTIAAIVLIDQLTKHLIRTNFQVGETLPVISDVLHLTYVRNRGAAFSMFENTHFVTIIIPIIIIASCIGALIYFRKEIPSKLAFFIALIIAGGMSNLFDRIMLGYVTDMIDFRIFPVFNIADIAVCLGCALLIIYEFFFDRGKDNKTDPKESERE